MLGKRLRHRPFRNFEMTGLFRYPLARILEGAVPMTLERPLTDVRIDKDEDRAG